VIAGRIFLYIVVFLISLALFLPKGDLLQLAQEQFLKNEGVALEAKIGENLTSTSLEGVKLSYKNGAVANIENGSIFSLLFFSSIGAENITLQGMAAGMLPKNISEVKITHTIFSPMKIRFSSNGEFGSARGVIDLESRVVIGDLYPSEVLQKGHSFVLQGMKKNGDKYTFENKF